LPEKKKRGEGAETTCTEKGGHNAPTAIKGSGLSPGERSRYDRVSRKKNPSSPGKNPSFPPIWFGREKNKGKENQTST